MSTLSLRRTMATETPLLLFAGALYACALKYFVLPAQVVLTGTEGISASLSYYFESDLLFIGLYLVFQIVLISFGWVKVGRGFALRSAAVVLMVVAGLLLLPDLVFADPHPTKERMLLVLFGGILAGAAKALAFRQRGSTGDEDILGAYFAMKFLQPVGSVAIAAAVVSTTFGLLLFLMKTGEFEAAVNVLMYTAIYIFVSAEALNTLYPKFRLTMFTIITAQPAEIGEAIVRATPHRTYTIQDGVGGRTGRRFQMVRTVLTHEELPEVIDEIEKSDPDAFYYFHDVEGVSRQYYITPIGSSGRTRDSQTVEIPH